MTIWADLRSLHILLDGHLVRTIVSRLLPEDLAYLVMRHGARPAGPAPAAAALAPSMRCSRVTCDGVGVEDTARSPMTETDTRIGSLGLHYRSLAMPGFRDDLLAATP